MEMFDLTLNNKRTAHDMDKLLKLFEKKKNQQEISNQGKGRKAHAKL